MPFCSICNKPIIGTPALVAYPSNGPTIYYCEPCATDVYQDALVGKTVRIHDREKYDSISEAAHILGMIAAGLMAND